MKFKVCLGSSILAFFLACSCFAGNLPKPNLIYPHGGESFTPGQTVKLKWNISSPNNAHFCEQEIYMIVDKISYRITPELGARARSYDWIVPNISGTAVLELHLGCDVINIFEAKNVESSRAFTILGK